MCLACRYSCRVPSGTEKIMLQNAGLGFKKIKLDMADNEEAVFNKLTSGEKEGGDEESLTVIGYPQLKDCG